MNLIGSTTVLAIAALLPPASHADVTHRVVMKAGDDGSFVAPGLTVTSTFTGLIDPVINQNGDTAFWITLGGPGITDVLTNGVAIVVVPAAGGPRSVLRLGDAAPGLGGLTLAGFGNLNLNNTGRLAFSSTLAGAGVTTANDNALYLDVPGSSPLLLLREGGAAPGFAPGISTLAYDTTGQALNDLNQVAIAATLTGGGISATNDTLIYLSAAANPSLLVPIVREGDPADFIAPGLTLASVSIPLLAGNGNVVFVAGVVGNGVTTANDRALVLRRTDGSLSKLMREGDPIPDAQGVPIGTFWGAPISSSLTSDGTLLFYAALVGLIPNYSAIWTGPHDGSAPFRPAAVLGASAGGLVPGQTLNALTPIRFAAADGGRAAFFATIAGTGVTTANDGGVFSEAIDGLGQPRLLAREGSPAVGVTPAANHPAVTDQFGAIAANARNQTVFSVRAATLGDGRDFGLWAVHATGEVTLLCYKTMSFTVAPGDTRTINFFGQHVGSGSNAWRTWLNNRGEVVYSAAFIGEVGANSAVIVSSIDPPSVCRADFNGLGGVTIQDLLDFLGAWFVQAPAADVDGAPGVTLQDLFDFLALWFAGC